MKNILYALIVVTAVFALNGCGGSRSGGGTSLAPNQVATLSDFGANQFNHKVYVKGMSKVARNTLYWQDPNSKMGDFHTIKIEGPSDTYLPINANVPHKSNVESFGRFFDSYLDLKQSSNSGSLRVVIEVVECNPGSRAARYWVGMGAGKAAGTVVIEVYEPGKTTPSLKLYARDSASMGGFGGDSISMMNSIYEAIAKRLTTVLEGRIDVSKTGRNS